jgi:DnaJ-class molecular chaperone
MVTRKEETCYNCGGIGHVTTVQSYGAFTIPKLVDCPICKGSGKIIKEESK